MKKWIAILLTLSMALAFAACKGGDTGKPSQPDDASASQQTSAEPSENGSAEATESEQNSAVSPEAEAFIDEYADEIEAFNKENNGKVQSSIKFEGSKFVVTYKILDASVASLVKTDAFSDTLSEIDTDMFNLREEYAKEIHDESAIIEMRITDPSDNLLLTRVYDGTLPDDDDDAQPSVGGMTLQALIDSGMLSELVPEDENAKMEFSVKGNDTLVMTYIFQKDFSAIEVAALKEQLANQDVQELADSMDGLKEGLGAVISVDDLKVEVIYQTKGGEVLFNQTF